MNLDGATSSKRYNKTLTTLLALKLLLAVPQKVL
jgi:hypothetical protein